VPTQQEILDYGLANDQIAEAGERDAVGLIRTGLPWATIVTAYPDTIAPYISASEIISAQWYEDLDPASGFVVDLDDIEPVSRDSLENNMRWAINQNNPEEAIGRSANRQVRNGGRGVIESNARREGVMWTRQARPDACGFCRIMATRGDVYYSRSTAGGYSTTSYHDGCHCVAVPSRPGSPYTPPDYVKKWNAEYAEVSRNVTPKEGQSQILAYSDAMQPRGPGTAYPGQ
jgi:hypothetical protein